MKQLIYKYAALFAILWAAVIFVLCATPGQYIPTNDWLELLSVDKLVHATMFFVLSSLLFLVAIRHKQAAGIIAFYFCLCVFYGVFLEWMQANYFSNRSSDWHDMVANTCGCIIALAVLKKLGKTFAA